MPRLVLVTAAVFVAMFQRQLMRPAAHSIRPKFRPAGRQTVRRRGPGPQLTERNAVEIVPFDPQGVGDVVLEGFAALDGSR